MSTINQRTIQAYEKEAEVYIKNTPSSYQRHHKQMLSWMDALARGKEGRRLLEVGSATNRDATYLREKGLIVQTSDASIPFIDNLKKQGESPLFLDASHNPLPDGFDVIFANAVFPHFTYSGLYDFIIRTSQYFPLGGRLGFNLKMGLGEGWVLEKIGLERFIRYWQPQDIIHLLQSNGFVITFFESNVSGDLPSHLWINIVVEKRQELIKSRLVCNTQAPILPFSRRHLGLVH